MIIVYKTIYKIIFFLGCTCSGTFPGTRFWCVGAMARLAGCCSASTMWARTRSARAPPAPSSPSAPATTSPGCCGGGRATRGARTPSICWRTSSMPRKFDWIAGLWFSTLMRRPRIIPGPLLILQEVRFIIIFIIIQLQEVRFGSCYYYIYIYIYYMGVI